MLKFICFGLFLAFATACENSGKFSEQTCTSWKDKGFCKDSPYEQFMADNCAKTCGCLEENTVYTDDCTNEGIIVLYQGIKDAIKEQKLNPKIQSKTYNSFPFLCVIPFIDLPEICHMH